MTTRYMFISYVIPHSTNLKNRIDVYSQPLIDELDMLWDVGVETSDVSCAKVFRLHTTLMG